MALSRLIEYIASLERPEGGRYAYVGIAQTMVLVFPAGTTLTASTSPIIGDYAYIGYGGAFGPSMIPEAFEGWGQQAGARQYTGVITEWFLSNVMDSYIVVTPNEPSLGQITNVTPVNQYYEWISFILTIASKEDYDAIRDAISVLNVAEATNLLRKMDAARYEPSPPIV